MEHLIDLSSTEAHINVECPLCGKMWMEEVVEGNHGVKCDCPGTYKMTKLNNGQVELTFSFPSPLTIKKQ